MTFKVLVKLWEEYNHRYGDDAYKHISELLREAKELHRRDFLKNPNTKGRP